MEVYANESPPIYKIVWNQHTLHHIPAVYRNRCERDGYYVQTLWLAEDDLEPDTGEPAPMEQPANLGVRSLSRDSQEDRIRAVFCLTADEPLPEVRSATLVKYYHYLVEHLSLPFSARYRPKAGPFAGNTIRGSVLGLFDINDYVVEERHGLIGVGGCGGKRIEFPMNVIDIDKKDPNYQLIEDYAYWFVNY